jgi:hypothetical protein
MKKVEFVLALQTEFIFKFIVTADSMSPLAGAATERWP